MTRDRIIQLVAVLVAAAALSAAGMLHGRMLEERRQSRLDIVTGDSRILKDPSVALLQAAPGGLRAPLVSYLWIRSQNLKSDGRFYDAQQLRSLLCELMPHSGGVWDYHAWDMAYNISVDTHTPQERWMWVYNGIKLLRDRGIYYNPDDILLYRELGWIFYHKIVDTTDDMHYYYKQRVAADMHRLLGDPPVTDDSQPVIDAFREIASAPATVEELTNDAQAADFLAALAAAKLKPDRAMLDYFNKFAPESPDAPYGLVRQQPKTEEKPVADLMTSLPLAPGRRKIVAFARADALRHEYHMDPAWMLGLMEKYGPLDWRNPLSHSLYWGTLGLSRSGNRNLNLQQVHAQVMRQMAKPLEDINALNTERVVEFSLRDMALKGQIIYSPDPRRPDEPQLTFQYDHRFIETTNQAYVEAGAVLVGSPDRIDSFDNSLREGHINFLENQIIVLYIEENKAAQHYYDFLRERLRPRGDVYTLDLDGFVREKLKQLGAVPTMGVSAAIWQGSLRGAYIALAAGNLAKYNTQVARSRKVYEAAKQEYTAKRLNPPPFEEIDHNMLATLMVRPRSLGLNLTLLQKWRLWESLPEQKKAAVYELVIPTLREECKAEDFDPDKAFPPPGQGQ